VNVSRLREFDRADVVTKALNLFWSDGYNASSISKLIDVMGINRGSLYATFRNKASLFSEAMSNFTKSSWDFDSAKMVGIDDPLQDIRGFYYSIFLSDGETISNGCLLFNTVSELSNTLPEVAVEARDHLLELKALFLNRLTDARDNGMIDMEKDLDVQADYLLAMMAGLHTLSKMDFDRASLKKVIDTTMDGLFS
jgi:TetR/AcrR family transcriptional repressor of nem operon